ncbi:hypothetical protein Zm00014a_027492 [Zea mays]|uniref:Wound-responsive family protein n=1 Tax=Zea mays TaxID=4577 RepID=A0A3L6DIW3_MAIZE|nr:hypothetical protein Zm00014a_027492 [Zea mays]
MRPERNKIFGVRWDPRKTTRRAVEPGGSANVAPKKRRRKDASSTYLETNHLAPVNYFDIGYVPGKSSARDAPLELRDLEKQKAAPPPVSYAHKSKTSEAFDYAYPADRDKGTSAQLGFQQRKHPVVGRAGSCIKPKGTRLERGIRDLQKIAAEYRPPTIDINEVDPNGQAAVKRRLPPEVKQKVARLSANQGKIQEHELMNRLMGIVGHLVQRRTLKVRSEERMKRKRLAAAAKLEDGFPVVMRAGVAPQVSQPDITNITYHAADYGQNQGLNFF